MFWMSLAWIFFHLCPRISSERLIAIVDRKGSDRQPPPVFLPCSVYTTTTSLPTICDSSCNNWYPDVADSSSSGAIHAR